MEARVRTALSWSTGRAAGIGGVGARAEGIGKYRFAAGPTIPPFPAGRQPHACENGGEFDGCLILWPVVEGEAPSGQS